MNALAHRYARAFFRAARGLPKRLIREEGINTRNYLEGPSSYAAPANRLTDAAPSFSTGHESTEALRTLRARRRAQMNIGRLLFEACDH